MTTRDVKDILMSSHVASDFPFVSRRSLAFNVGRNALLMSKEQQNSTIQGISKRHQPLIMSQDKMYNPALHFGGHSFKMTKGKQPSGNQTFNGAVALPNLPPNSDYHKITGITTTTGKPHLSEQHSDSTVSGNLPQISSNRRGSIISRDTPTTLGSQATHESEDTRHHVNPREALRFYRHKLTQFEQEEILDFNKIWFVGPDSKKIDAVRGATPNHGFDDDNGSYHKVIHDHIAYRYEVLETLGKGSFGQVVKAIDHQSGRRVALKIIRNKKRFHQQATVEVKILEHLKKPDNPCEYMVHMIESFVFRNHFCIVFELLGNNLYEVIKKNRFQGFTMPTVKQHTYALLQCLLTLHNNRLIHCDLKPENILVLPRTENQIKMIDFGSSCYEHQRVYTYIQSRFYRAPEVILGMPYSMPIDMWSLGCILPELFTGYPLFPGKNEVEQLACIMEICGLPPKSVLDQATRKRLFFDSRGHPRTITNAKGKKRIPGSKEIDHFIKSKDPKFIDFIMKCLEWSPSQRLTPQAALQHPWIRDEVQKHKNSKAKGSLSFSSGDHIEAIRQRLHKEKTRIAELKNASQKDSVPITTTNSKKTIPEVITSSPKVASNLVPKRAVSPTNSSHNEESIEVNGASKNESQAATDKSKLNIPVNNPRKSNENSNTKDSHFLPVIDLTEH